MTNNKLNILQWYETLEEQEYQAKWWSWGEKFQLASPQGRLLAFQVPIPPLNAQPTSFTVTHMATNTVYDITSEMLNPVFGNLQVQSLGDQNYDPVGIAPEDPSVDNVTVWGFSIGTFQSFRYLQTFVERVPFVPPGLPDTWNVNAVLYDGDGGNVLGFQTLTGIAPPTSGQYQLDIDFGSIIDNSAGDVLWLELRSNLPIWLYGKVGTLNYTPEQSKYGLTVDGTTSPTVPIGVAGSGDFDAHVLVSGGNDSLFDLAIYAGRPHAVNMPLGMYYATMEIAGNSYYSEIYTIVSDVTDYLRLSYWHRSQFDYPGGAFIYTNQLGEKEFEHVCYIPTDLGYPSYQLEQELNARSGIKYKLRQVSYKELRFRFIAPEYLIDALRVIPLHHDCEVRYKGVTYTVDDIIINPEWLEGGYLANVEIVFRTDQVIVENGDNIAPLPPSTQNQLWESPGGDFWVDPNGSGWNAPLP